MDQKAPALAKLITPGQSNHERTKRKKRRR